MAVQEPRACVEEHLREGLTKNGDVLETDAKNNTKKRTKKTPQGPSMPWPPRCLFLSPNADTRTDAPYNPDCCCGCCKRTPSVTSAYE